ncbi:RNA-binding protein, partial [Pseudomonas syringae pv. tagetis]
AQQSEAVGLKVGAMRRIRIGGVSMGNLPEGQWRYMTTKEKF